MDAIESGDIEQKVTCPECGRSWLDVFILGDQRELAKGGA